MTGPVDLTDYTRSDLQRARQQGRGERVVCDLIATDTEGVDITVWRGLVEMTADGYVPVEAMSCVAGYPAYKWRRQPGWVAG